MKNLILAASIAFGSAAHAQDGGEALVQAMSSVCLTKLDSGVFNENGLTRGTAQMEAALLSGRDGHIWRTADPRILIADFESESLCETMGLSVDIAEFSDALLAWHGIEGAAYTISGDANLSLTESDGVYFVRKTDNDEYVQVTITSYPEIVFIGIVMTRVETSFAAREVLGEEE